MVKKTKIVRPEDTVPVIMIANYFTLRSSEQSWGTRSLSEYELIYIVAGEFSYIESDKSKIRLYEGDVLCIPPGVRHVFRCEKTPIYGSVISCIHLELLKNGSRMNDDYRPEKEPPLVTSMKGDYTIHQLFRNAKAVKEGYSRFREALLENIGREIWLRLAESWEGENSSAYTPRIRKMISFIESKIPDPVSRQDLSREFALTPEHINTLFKGETGITPTQAVHRARINLACRYLLEEGLSIKETAEKVGFKDEFYFSKVFKKVMDITPGRIVGR